MMCNASGNVIYALPFIDDEEIDQINTQYKGQAVTIDSFDYSTIGELPNRSNYCLSVSILWGLPEGKYFFSHMGSEEEVYCNGS